MGWTWYRWPLALYDRAYRWAHGLDRYAARIGPIIRLEQQRQRARAILPDGTVVNRGAPIGVIHLDNAVVAALHTDGRSPQATGLEFRRLFVRSLRQLAILASPGGRLAHLQAFAATTIFPGLRRLDFTPMPGPIFPRVVGAYQRALLSSLHPMGHRATGVGRPHAAQRLMISQRTLIARYGVFDFDGADQRRRSIAR
jgi:hypothetical protein